MRFMEDDEPEITEEGATQNQGDEIQDVILIQRRKNGEMVLDVDTTEEEFSEEKFYGLIEKAKNRVSKLPIQDLLDARGEEDNEAE